MADYIPAPDAQFDEWLTRFAAYCTANQAALGLKATQVNKLNTAAAAWRTAYTEHQTAQTTARAKTQNKSDKRDDTMATVRQTVGIIQSNPDVTDEQRQAAGLTVADSQPTPGMTGANAGINSPLLLLCDFSQRGRCTIHFGPNPSNERQNAKPHGVRGVKIWFAIIAPGPTGVPGAAIPESAWQWLADDTSSPYLHVLGVAQSTTVAYRAQYFDNRMNLGPMCDPVLVTVTV